MSKSIISICLLGASSMVLSTQSLAATDPITGVWQGTTSFVRGATAPIGGMWVPVQQGTTTVVRGVATPVEGVWTPVEQGTTTVVQDVASPANGLWTPVQRGTTSMMRGVTTPLGGFFGPVSHRHMYTVTDMNTGTSRMVSGGWNGQPILGTDVRGCTNGVFPGICQGVRYTITDSTTGKQYLVTGVKQGTMDVMHGTRMIRYQYVMPVVRPL